MKIKLDENLPDRLCDILRIAGHQPDTVRSEGLTGSGDDEVWAAAQASGAFLITQDLDFSDVRRFVPGTHCGLMLIRLREPGREALFRRLRSVLESESVQEWSGHHVVVTDRKIRVRAPRS